MGKKKTSKKKKEIIKPIRASIEELEQSRTGGQIALTGFSYQFLYSCYLILSESNENTTFHLEGIEDIDHYKCEVSSKSCTHIQLKYSTQKQDASFLKDVLKNFLEAYLFDASHNFKLVYDFTLAKGNLSKIINNSLDESSTKYWEKIVLDIKAENSNWNWTGFSFGSFIENLSFEKQNKMDLSKKIEKLLIEKYDITTGNIDLFANGIKICCLEKMERRESINQQQLSTIIQSIKDDINKGILNPAHRWIKKLDFNISNYGNDISYFEGKKASPQDIVMQLPVRRIHTEKEIEESIQNNRVTVIKASSGQGKTTMALQVAFNLLREYSIYQLVWCNDSKELDNIVQYFKSRVKLGEKPLIVIDNLDSLTCEWNRLAQLLQEEVSYHYKLLLTTREDDWYNYSGNLSNVKSLQVVNLALNEQDAKSIFEVLQKSQKLHQSITDWKSSWSKVSDKKLLIEFVYLLTHGEMISERVAHQIYQINNTDTGRIKCEILRKVSFADICGIKIPVSKLVGSLLETTNRDYGEILKSVENEFLIRVDTTEKYVEGLHPVRSQHIVDKLHEYAEISDTALQIVKITDVTYLPKLFSNLPHLITKNKAFYSKIVEILWDADNLSQYVLALKGLFSGSVMQYYVQNQGAFDNANNHGGLYLLSMELNPFTQFEEFEYSVQTLDELKKITPNNANIQYLCDLRNSVPKIVLSETYLYYFCEALFIRLKTINLDELPDDIPSYATIAYWLLNIDRKFNLTTNISLDAIWADKDNYTINVISNIMYTCFCGNKETYISFVNENLQTILRYLKNSTASLKLFISEDKNKIHVEYILLPSEIRKGNEESVSRLMLICKTLPIFEIYCADAVMPTLDIISGYNIPDDAHKAMPLRNIIIMFHQEFASLWDKTIMSNYECDSIFEWLNNWFTVRKNITTLSEKCTASINKLLEGKQLGILATEINTLRTEINKELIREYRYPYQDRPFEEKAFLPEGFSKIKADYFGSIQNFCHQLAKFFSRDLEQSRIALFNLTKAFSTMERMQKYFGAIVDEQGMLIPEHNELCVIEERSIQLLTITCEYFKEHMPSKYFNKYAIKSWYSKNYEDLMIDSKTALSALSEDFLLTYPVKYFNDGILKFYPIIVDNLDITNPEVLLEFLYLCTPIANLDYSYLVIANKNKQSQIFPSGLRVPIQYFKDLRVAVDTGDEELIQKLTPPFPEEIGQQFLDCFEQKYELFIPSLSKYEGVNSILELLWTFSRSKKELIAEFDSDYQSSIEKNLKVKIFSLLKKIENQMPYNDFCELTQICEDTFMGKLFEDGELNSFNNKLIAKDLSNYQKLIFA
jgi:hypothetical protein